MIKEKNNLQNENQKTWRIFKNKAFIKWCKYNIVILILGISLIFNIIYITKVFNETINHNNNVTNVAIEAINADTTVLTKSDYITTFSTLGDLLSACSNDFTIKKSQSGRFLVAIKGKQFPNKFWQITYWNGENFTASKVGIDNIKLKNNDWFQFQLIQFTTVL